MGRTPVIQGPLNATHMLSDLRGPISCYLAPQFCDRLENGVTRVPGTCPEEWAFEPRSLMVLLSHISNVMPRAYWKSVVSQRVFLNRIASPLKHQKLT